MALMANTSAVSNRMIETPYGSRAGEGLLPLPLSLALTALHQFTAGTGAPLRPAAKSIP
jgi:hypothetical protein